MCISHLRPLKVIALHCIALHCIALHCIALHCIALHCIALHCIALHWLQLATTAQWSTTTQSHDVQLRPCTAAQGPAMPSQALSVKLDMTPGVSTSRGQPTPSAYVTGNSKTTAALDPVTSRTQKSTETERTEHHTTPSMGDTLNYQGSRSQAQERTRRKSQGRRHTTPPLITLLA